MEVLTLIAIAVGPFAALYIHGKLEERKREYERRLDIFKTLMATRGAALSPDHVEALNRIDMEFVGEQYAKIRELWAIYLDHLNNAPQPPDVPRPDATETEVAAWQRKLDGYAQDSKNWNNGCTDRLVALLKEMSTAFNYKNFDEVRIRKGVYRPKGHFDLENAQIRLLEAAAATFEGRRHFPMAVTNWPEQGNEQQVLLERLLTSVDRDGAYRVRIVGEPKQAIPVPDR